MITRVLHGIFAAIRFVHLEWVSWSEAQEEPRLSQQDAVPIQELTEERVVEEELRERLNGKATTLTDQQIRNASIAFVEARQKIEARDATIKERTASRR